MRQIPRIACINDLSGFGRCSLTTAIPVLAVMGAQPCPAPTAVLSKHTGFPEFSFTDLTDSLPEYFQTWSDLDFDWIYSGFLGSAGQITAVRDFFHAQKEKNENCRILLDPVMGDDGRRYSTCTPPLCDAMRQLAAEADVITPNITEACLLAELPYCGETLRREEAEELAKKVQSLGCKAVVLTGIMQDSTIGNLIWEKGGTAFSAVPRTERIFSGAGDLFASVLLGALARKKSLFDAVQMAGAFLSAATEYTLQQDTPVCEGIVFEPLLSRLEEYFP